MTQLPTYWYNTSAFWDGRSSPKNINKCSNLDIAYPTWAMKPELKAYYLIQFAYWWQQLLVLILGLEKPRKDYLELVAHHFVTLWLIGCVLHVERRIFIFVHSANADGVILLTTLSSEMLFI